MFYALFSVLPVFSPDVDSLDPAFSLHMDILPKDCSDILEPLMLNIYGLMLEFCIVFSFELVANAISLGCFWSCYPSCSHHLRQPFLLQCFEYAPFWICPHLEDLPKYYYSSLNVTLLFLGPKFLSPPGLIDAWCFLICWMFSIAVWHFDVICCFKLSLWSSVTPRYLILSARSISVLLTFNAFVLHLSSWGFDPKNNEFGLVVVHFQPVLVHPDLRIRCTLLQFNHTSYFVTIVSRLKSISNCMVICEMMIHNH